MQSTTAAGLTPCSCERASALLAKRRLVEALSELKPDHRRLIELRHFQQLSFADVGGRLGRSANAVELLHRRIPLRLSDRLRTD